MDNATLEILLNKVESDTLDFKAQQYRFYGATDDDKSELLKDILAFANGWKETDAHIIIGIDEKDGRATTVTGVRRASVIPQEDLRPSSLYSYRNEFTGSTRVARQAGR